ncbi:MAG: outer membrane beta-barrel family protein [Bacteroidota bacterium]
MMIYLKKLPLLLLLSVLSYTYSFSQCQISGKIADGSNAAIPYAPIALMNSTDSTIYKGILTDEKGNYCFNGIKAGTYILKILVVGFADTYSEKIEFDSTSKIIAPIIVKIATQNLNEVTVNAIKDPIEYKNGNIIVNIEGSPLAVGNSVYDLLSHLPGVIVQNDNITIQGSSGVKIFIDDRVQQMSGQQLINLLRSINSSSIEKIEILKNPPVKYDASGTAGIINIKTKKIKITGFSGSVNYNLAQGVYNVNSGGVSLNYKWNKVAIFSNVDGYMGRLRFDNNFKKSITTNSVTTVFDQQAHDYDNGKYLTINLGADWYVNKNNILGFRFQSNPGYAMRSTSGNNYISDNSLGYSQLNYNSATPNSWTYNSYNFSAEHLFDTLGTKLTFSTDYYTPYLDVYQGTYENKYLDINGNETSPSINFKSDNTLNLNIISSKLDFEKKLSKTLSLEAGVKESFQKITSDYVLQNKNNLTGEYTIDNAFTNKFSYAENISAAYLNLQKQIDKLSLQVGLRGENTAIHTESITTNFKYNKQYFKVFPVISLDYKKSEKNVFQLSYNNRINRPNYNSFNPYKSFINTLTSSIGNPYLMPTISNTINFSHTYNGKISNSFSYRRVSNPFIRYSSQNDSTKESIFQIGNLKNSNILEYSLFMRTDVYLWWSLTFNAGAYYVDYIGKINGLDYSNSAFSYYGYIGNQFLLPKNIKIELSGNFNGPRLEEVYYYKPLLYVGFAIKKSFLKDKLNFTLGMNDIFKLGAARYSVNFQDQKWESYQYYDSRRIYIGVSYDFGKIKVEQRETSASKAEQQRLGH